MTSADHQMTAALAEPAESIVEQTLRDAPPDLRRLLAGIAAERQQMSSGPYPDGTTPDEHAQEDAERAAAVASVLDTVGRLTWRHQMDMHISQAYAQKDPAELREWLLSTAALCAAWAQDIDHRPAPA